MQSVRRISEMLEMQEVNKRIVDRFNKIKKELLEISHNDDMTERKIDDKTAKTIRMNRVFVEKYIDDYMSERECSERYVDEVMRSLKILENNIEGIKSIIDE